MNRIVAGLAVAVLTASFSMTAEAQRRLGGGRNVGKQSPSVSQKQATPPAAATPPSAQGVAPGAAAPAAGGALPGAAAGAVPGAAVGAASAAPRAGMAAGAAKAASPMRNLLIGAAAGLGLMALANALGFGEGFAQFAMILLAVLALALVVGFVVRRMRAGNNPRPAMAGAAAGTLSGYGIGGPSYSPPPGPHDHTSPTTHRSAEPELNQPAMNPAGSGHGARPGSAMDEFMRGGAPATPPQGFGPVPTDFDTTAFLNQAKLHFSRLQDAWDRANLDTLADFTTQEMFTALTHELRDRGTTATRSEVISLEATLLGVETDIIGHTASVRFAGSLNVNGETESLDEVWNLLKPRDGSAGWLLAGIQQLS